MINKKTRMGSWLLKVLSRDIKIKTKKHENQPTKAMEMGWSNGKSNGK